MSRSLMQAFTACAFAIGLGALSPADAREGDYSPITSPENHFEPAEFGVPGSIKTNKYAVDGYLTIALDISPSMGGVERKFQAQFAEALESENFKRALEQAPRGIIVNVITLAGDVSHDASFHLRDTKDIAVLKDAIRNLSFKPFTASNAYTDTHGALDAAIQLMKTSPFWGVWGNNILVVGDAHGVLDQEHALAFEKLRQEAGKLGIAIHGIPFLTSGYENTYDFFNYLKTPEATFVTRLGKIRRVGHGTLTPLIPYNSRDIDEVFEEGLNRALRFDAS